MQGPGIEDAFNKQFGEVVREIRESKEWSQRQFADALEQAGLKLDPSAITRIERGTREVKLREAVTMASVLGVDVSRLLQWNDEPAVRMSTKFILGLRRVNLARSELARMVADFVGAADIIDQHPQTAQHLTFGGESPSTGIDFLRKILADPLWTGGQPVVKIAGDTETREVASLIVAAVARDVIDPEPPEGGAQITYVAAPGIVDLLMQAVGNAISDAADS